MHMNFKVQYYAEIPQPIVIGVLRGVSKVSRNLSDS